MKALNGIVLAVAPWCAGFAIGYSLIALPIAGMVLGLVLLGAGAWLGVRALRNGRTRASGWLFLVALLLALSTLFGLAGGAGLAAHGMQSPWAGLLTAAMAWLIVQIQREGTH